MIVREAKVLYTRNCQGVRERLPGMLIEWLERISLLTGFLYLEIVCYEMEQICSLLCNNALGELGRWHCVVCVLMN
jgi:hypothetical protein